MLCLNYNRNLQSLYGNMFFHLENILTKIGADMHSFFAGSNHKNFVKIFFIIFVFTRRQLCCNKGTRRNVQWTFQGQGAKHRSKGFVQASAGTKCLRSRQSRRLCRPHRAKRRVSRPLMPFLLFAVLRLPWSNTAVYFAPSFERKRELVRVLPCLCCILLRQKICAFLMNFVSTFSILQKFVYKVFIFQCFLTCCFLLYFRL